MAILLVLVVGCGSQEESLDILNSSELRKKFGGPNLTTVVESLTTESSDTVLEAEVTRDEQGNVIGVSQIDSQITDAGLALLKDLTFLQDLYLHSCEKITDAGLVHLKGADETVLPQSRQDPGHPCGHRQTEEGVAEVQYLEVLKKTLPNCLIYK